MKKGKVIFYSIEKGFGFIQIENTEDSIYFHISGLIDKIRENDNVNFEESINAKGRIALKVSLLKPEEKTPIKEKIKVKKASQKVIPKAINIVDIEKQIDNEKQNVSYDIREFTLEYYVDKYLKNEEEGTNELFVPEYQREFIWDENRQSRFIESVILGLPVPLFFVAEINEGSDEFDGRLEIVDGSQRIRTLAAFISNELTLHGLRKLTELNDLKFENLKPSRQRLIKNTSMRMIVLSSRADEKIRNEMFDRINTSSVPLEPMETRRGVYRGKFTDFVIKCASKEEFLNLVPLLKFDKNRRKEEEYVLRFFAFTETFPKFSFQGESLKSANVATFLDNYVKYKNENFVEATTLIMEEKFDRMLDFVQRTFGKRGFAKKDGVEGVSSIYFEAIAIGAHFALEENPNLKCNDISWSELNKSTPNDFFKILPGRYKTHTAAKLKDRINYAKIKFLNK